MILEGLEGRGSLIISIDDDELLAMAAAGTWLEGAVMNSGEVEGRAQDPAEAPVGKARENDVCSWPGAADLPLRWIRGIHGMSRRSTRERERLKKGGK